MSGERGEDILQEAYARIDRNLRTMQLKDRAERLAGPRDPGDLRPLGCVLGRCRRHRRCYRGTALDLPCAVLIDVMSRCRS